MTKALLDDVLALAPAERLELMDQIWDSLANQPDAIPFPAEHRYILEERLKEHRENPGNVIAWEVIRSRYLSPE